MGDWKREEPMSSSERCEQLLKTIDAVLSECGKDPRRHHPTRLPARPAWGGPSWSQDQWAPDVRDFRYADRS